MKKILIFGCSFTLGSYKPISKELVYSNEDWIAPDELIRGSYGWWYFVNYFKNKEVTIIALSERGYWAFYQILLYLEENKELNYDEIWIQETREPRPTIEHFKKTIEQLNKPGVKLNGFNLKAIDPVGHLSLSRRKISKEFEPFAVWISFFEEMTKSCARNIDNLCAEKNIKGYVWSMYEPIMENNHFIRLPLQYMKKKLKEKNLLVPGEHIGMHQTEEGNKYIGKLINEALN